MEKPGRLQSMWLQRVEHDWETSLSLSPVKGFGLINKVEIDVFLQLSCFFYDPTDVGNLISGSKSSLNIWMFTLHILLKPGLEDFGHYFASMWDESNCEVVWTFFCIAFLWDSDGKRDLGSIPGSGRFPGEENGNPLKYSCLESPMDGEAW